MRKEKNQGFQKKILEFIRVLNLPSVSKEKQGHMIELLTKYLSGNTTSNKEQQTIKQWLQKESNKKKFHNLKQLWLLMDDYQTDYKPDLTQGWQKFSKRVHQQIVRRRIFYSAVSAAAVLLVVFLMQWLVPLEGNNSITITGSQSVETILLPDSSRIYLKQGSTASYRADFTPRRVELNGEAFFEVTKQKGQAFTVQGHHTQVDVLGTSFNYRTTPDCQKAQLAVLTGKVRFTAEADQAITVTKGQQVALEGEQIVKTPITDINFLFYKTKRLEFKNRPLSEILKTIEQYYGEKLVMSTKDTIEVSVTFDHAGIETIIEELELITGRPLKRLQ
jgi:ferric-dicitrate binding protein FerR (iron transport regulator)